MTMASGLYGVTLRDVFDASALPVDYISDTIKFLLVTDTHTPAFDTDDEITDVDNQIANGSGYTTGGVTLGTKTLVASSSVLTFDAADAAWTTSTFSAVRGGIMWDDTVTTPTADPLIMAMTFGADYAVTSGTFTVQFNASGIFYITYA